MYSGQIGALAVQVPATVFPVLGTGADSGLPFALHLGGKSVSTPPPSLFSTAAADPCLFRWLPWPWPLTASTVSFDMSLLAQKSLSPKVTTLALPRLAIRN
jgi:hypothetical protein